MAWFNVMAGGCVCVGTRNSYESDAAMAADETNFHELCHDLTQSEHFEAIEQKVIADGLTLKLSVADNDDGCWFVASVGKEIHQDTYILKGEIRTLDPTLSDEEKANVLKHLDEIENYLRIGHGTERQLGIIFDHFD
jgi:hypothetical protein